MTPDGPEPRHRPAPAEAERRERFEELAAQVVDPVRRYLARRTDAATADDVLSETLLVCWRRPAQVPDDAPVAWAIGVSRRVLANAERAGRRRGLLARRIAAVDPPAQRVRGPGESTPEQDGADAAAAAVDAAMAELGPKDAEVLRLWAWEELAPAQIAVVLGISANASAVRLHRAKARLRTCLAPRLPDRSGPVGRPVRTDTAADRNGTRDPDEEHQGPAAAGGGRQP